MSALGVAKSDICLVSINASPPTFRAFWPAKVIHLAEGIHYPLIFIFFLLSHFNVSNLRPEATGYGLVYFWMNLLQSKGKAPKGLRLLVSGSGMISQPPFPRHSHANRKRCSALRSEINSGWRDSTYHVWLRRFLIPIPPLFLQKGYVLEPYGFTQEKLDLMMKLKNEGRGRLSEYTKLSKSAKVFGIFALLAKSHSIILKRSPGALPQTTLSLVQPKMRSKNRTQRIWSRMESRVSLKVFINGVMRLSHIL